MRRIPNWRNVIAVGSTLLQSFGIVIVAAVFNTWWSYLIAFVLMTRGHVCLNILGHEAAHRLLFSNRRANDWTGRFLMAYPSYQAMLAYRRAHFAHHRDEMGPDEPDASLYAGYPIPADSWRRKLTRDAVGISAYKNFRVLFGAIRKRRSEALQILAVQIVMLGAVDRLHATARLCRLDRVVVELVAGLQPAAGDRRTRRDDPLDAIDARPPTSSVRHCWSRYWMVPYHTGWHLAHHVDMGVPWRNLPRLHDELVASGWVTPQLEYPSYRAFWKAASSGVQGGRERTVRRRQLPRLRRLRLAT